MAKSPEIKIYRNGEYVAACYHTEDAAAICAMTPGTEARWGHQKKNIIFIEPETSEEWAAGESWDKASRVMQENIKAIQAGRKPVLPVATT